MSEPGPGHNSGVAADQLLSFVTRIENLETEKKQIAEDIRDVLGEAAGTGFDKKAIREIVRIRAQDPADRAERLAIMDMYMSALGML